MLHNVTVKDDKLRIGGVSAESLTKNYGSPLYAYDAAVIRRQYRALVEHIKFPDTKIFYACKANRNGAILRLLRDEGCCLEAVSRDEVLEGLRAGFQPEDIVFTCSFIDKDELEIVAKKGVMINVDSLTQLEWLGQINPGGRVSMRINQGIGAGHHAHTITGGPDSKFGIDITQIDEAKKLAAKYGLRIVGIHQHIGSHILDPKELTRAMRTLLRTARSFDGLEFVDFGGGFGVDYKPEDEPLDMAELGSLITQEVERFVQSYGHVQIRFEPGRFLVARAGTLLATVTEIKETPHHTFVGVDSGFNHLIRPMMYDSYHKIVNASRVTGPRKKVWVVGNICESGDIFARDRSLTLCQPGDILAILDAGAYGFAMSFNYNGRAQPAEVLVDSGASRPISQSANNKVPLPQQIP